MFYITGSLSVVQQPMIQKIFVPQQIGGNRHYPNVKNGPAGDGTGMIAHDNSVGAVTEATAQQNVVPIQRPTQRFWITGAAVGGLFPKASTTTGINGYFVLKKFRNKQLYRYQQIFYCSNFSNN